MELTDPDLISCLLADPEKPRRATARRGSLEIVPAAPMRRPRRRCQCGQCRSCAENARWEKIFHDKFADPEYYEPKPIRFGSSLDWLGR